MPDDDAMNSAKKTSTAAASETQPRPKKKATKKLASKAKKPKSKSSKAKSSNVRRPYPRVTLEDALRVPYALKEKNGGNPWPPSDVAAAVGLSHKNTDFFYMAAASRDFGLTDGSRDSDLISLTDFGRDVVYEQRIGVSVQFCSD
jgi:hypothetical protein